MNKCKNCKIVGCEKNNAFKEETLTDKIRSWLGYKEKMINVKDVKKHIQNAQRRLKSYIKLKCVHPPFDLINEQNKIFKEEFGKELS